MTEDLLIRNPLQTTEDNTETMYQRGCYQCTYWTLALLSALVVIAHTV